LKQSARSHDLNQHVFCATKEARPVRRVVNMSMPRGAECSRRLAKTSGIEPPFVGRYFAWNKGPSEEFFFADPFPGVACLPGCVAAHGKAWPPTHRLNY